jgi:hypothetical protein
VVEPDDLYAVGLERFVAERGVLAKALRGEGRRDEAAEVAKLRKPSAAAWAVNQLVRSRGDEVQSLWEAGDALRGAQADLLAGRGDARALREAGDAVRDAVDALVEAARGGLGEQLGAATLERVGETLHAAALDEDARAAVAGGRLERELRHVGLGLGLGEGADVFAASPAPAAAKARAPAKKAKTKKGAKGDGAGKAAAAERLAAEKAARAEREATEKAARAEREAARKRARTVAAEAAKREERAAHALRAAEERRERAVAALAEADEALAAARARAEEAVDEHARARAALDAASG